MGVKGRLLDFINYKQITNKLFELTAGLSNGYINNFDGNFRTKTLEKVLTAYPDLNRNWLLYGEGEMLNSNSSRIVEATIVPSTEEVDVDLVAMLGALSITPARLAEIIGESEEYISICNGKLFPRHIAALESLFGEVAISKFVTLPHTNVVEAEIIESFPIVPEAVTTNPNTDIVKFVEENGSELETINPNQLLTDARVDIAERIKRTSMLPTFQPDDAVFIRFIKDKMKIVDGETYYLDCKNRPTMIRLVKFEGDEKLRLIAKNPQYGDIVIDRSDIINIGVVVALFRMTFGDQYSEMENLRRTKEEQLNRFIDIQSEMIAEIRESGKRNDRLIDKLMER